MTKKDAQKKKKTVDKKVPQGDSGFADAMKKKGVNPSKKKKIDF